MNVNIKKYGLFIIILFAAGIGLSLKDKPETPKWETGSSSKSDLKKRQKITIHIAGAVSNPGVYQVTPNQRVLEVLPVAGTLLVGANLDKINLATRIKDGQRILIPLHKRSKPSSVQKQSHTPKISLNLGTALQLSQIKGLGKKKAESIVEFRVIHGKYKTLEDVKKVKGIGVKLFKKIKPFLTL